MSDAQHLAPPRRVGPAAIVLVAIAFIALASIGIGAGLSKWYWGFAFARPDVDARVRHATKVHAYARHDRYPDGKGGLQIIRGTTGIPSVADVREAQRRAGGHHHLGTRIAGALHARGLLDDVTPSVATEAQVAAVPRLIRSVRHRLDPNDKGDWQENVTFVELDGPSGEPLFLLSGTSEPVANDHFAYYEFLFAGRVDDPAAPLLSATRFYFDNSGIEGTTWRDFAFAAAIVATAVVVPTAAFVLAVRCVRDRRAAARRGFTVGEPSAPLHKMPP